MSAEIEVLDQPPREAPSQPVLMPVVNLAPIAGASACQLLEGVQP